MEAEDRVARGMEEGGDEASIREALRPFHIEEAIRGVLSGDMEQLIEAHSIATTLGYDAFATKAPMPEAFLPYPVLAQAFEDGVLNAKCERALMTTGVALGWY